MLVFSPTDLIRLLTHYTQGLVPLDCEVKSFGVNPFLERFVGIEVESDEWDDFAPLQVRYEGKKVLGWTAGKGEEKLPPWQEANETPKRQ